MCWGLPGPIRPRKGTHRGRGQHPRFLLLKLLHNVSQGGFAVDKRGSVRSGQQPAQQCHVAEEEQVVWRMGLPHFSLTTALLLSSQRTHHLRKAAGSSVFYYWINLSPD